MSHVCVMIPGIMGSVLELNGQRIWPGPLLSLWLEYKYMKELRDPNLKATDVIRSYATTSVYQALIDDLGTLGFREADGSLVPFPYDWRKKNEDAAEELAKAIEKLPGDAEVSIVAHSMGGLIARYYLESGKFNARGGFDRVRRLVTLGTPHRGAPLALIRILGLEKAVWLSAAQVREAANDPDYPSAYQLLPPPGEPFGWDDVAGNAYGEIDVYDLEKAEARGLNVKCLQAAIDFHAALDPKKRPAHVRYFCFSGTQQTTATLAAIRQTATKFEVRKGERDGGGDGTVPFWSSTLPDIQCLAVGGEHSAIFKDRTLRRALATLFGKPGALGPAAFDVAPGVPAIEISIRDKVVEPGTPVRLVLISPAGARTLDGELRLEEAKDPVNAPKAFTPVGPPARIQYQGPAAESFGLIATAPPEPGAYRFAFYPVGSTRPSGTDEFFVQQAPTAAP